ncbi:MAG: phosphotransferase, partial [Anaerolineae bacterium]|nr:phosphotransferase [Anaerolineae bacterium]
MMINQLEARYTLYSSAEEMLAPETLSDMLKRKVTTVRLEPMGADFSSNQLFRVWADEQSLVMKSLFPRRDWLAIGSQDTLCRSVTLWQYGILDRVQPHLQHAQLAACHDGDDFSILMEDVSRGVFPPFQYSPPAMPQLFRILDSLAEMHALFWQDDSLKNPVLGLADIEVMQTLLSERYWEAIQDVAPHIFAMGKQGWNALFDMLEADSREIVQQVLNHPQAVVAKLASFPFTLRHGDFRLSNLAILPDTQQVVAFDWQQASYTPAA